MIACILKPVLEYSKWDGGGVRRNSGGKKKILKKFASPALLRWKQLSQRSLTSLRVPCERHWRIHFAWKGWYENNRMDQLLIMHCGAFLAWKFFYNVKMWEYLQVPHPCNRTNIKKVRRKKKKKRLSRHFKWITAWGHFNMAVCLSKSPCRII